MTAARLRIVVFTGGEMTAIDRMFYERLANDPLVELCAIIVDDYKARPRPIVKRIVRALREDGPRWIGYKLSSKCRALERRIALSVADRVHGPARMKELPVAMIHVADIHSAESVARIRSLAPDLGVIVGGRILRDTVANAPRLGSLNIHKRKLPEYRGGGPVGYWEVLAGESSIGVTIHYATRDVDAGPIVAEATISIEAGDTLETLKLKADLRGAQLYHDAIRAIARGQRHAVAQDLSRGTTYRAPSDYKVRQLQRKLEKAISRPRPSLLARLRVLIEWLAVLPHLQRRRKQLIRERRAPVSIFFYHLVSNRPLNHMSLPLDEFVRQMEFVQRYYPILSLNESVRRLRCGSNGEVAASITFDDGYRDNAWAIEYLRYLKIPAAFFLSIGHVRDGSSFGHDLKRGYVDARPMTEDDARRLAAEGFEIGSHGVYHENFGTLDRESAGRVLQESRTQIETTCGRAPDYFAFPKGQRGTNITPPALAAALEHYDSVFSAYGGYAFPERNRRDFVRMSNPADVFEMSLAMSGYTGFRQCLLGNGWGLKTAKLDPCGDPAPGKMPRVALIAASRRIIGGHSVQAAELVARLGDEGIDVSWIPIDARFPQGTQWIRRVPYLRTVCNEAIYLLSLLRLARADVVHVFAASYWSFILGPVPAVILAKLLRKPVVMHYHSGEADDHLSRWRRSVALAFRMADEIIVPSGYLQSVFSAHAYRARVIHNCINTARFPFRERSPLAARLLSVRSLAPYYQIENTIRAFALVKRRFPDATLAIAGDGPEEAHLREIAAKIGGIEFIGSVDPDALPAIYDKADIFLNSSIVDNQPVSILEAFACGLPVISTPTGDIPSMLLHGEAGLLVPPGDPSAMADAVARLLEDSELAVRLARRAREASVRFAAEQIGDQWLSVYRNIDAATQSRTNAPSLASHP